MIKMKQVAKDRNQNDILTQKTHKIIFIIFFIFFFSTTFFLRKGKENDIVVNL